VSSTTIRSSAAVGANASTCRLLLVLDHHDARLAVLDGVAHLLGQAVDVDADRDAPSACAPSSV